MANGTAFYFWVIWHSEYGDPLNDSDGTTSSNSDVTLNSTDASTGNHTFKFVPTTIGPINVTLTFQIDNYYAAIFNINVTSIESTSLTLNETTIGLKWRENTTLEIYYNDSSNTPIQGATIIVDEDTSHPAVYDFDSQAYYYELNSTQYAGVGDYLNLEISAQKTYYLPQTVYFDLIINPANTKIENISLNPFPQLNDVLSDEEFEFWLVWQSEFDDFLNAILEARSWSAYACTSLGGATDCPNRKSLYEFHQKIITNVQNSVEIVSIDDAERILKTLGVE